MCGPTLRVNLKEKGQEMKRKIPIFTLAFLLVFAFAFAQTKLITKSFELKYVEAQDVLPSVKKAFSKEGTVDLFALSRPEGNTNKQVTVLVVQDLQANLDNIEKILQTLDTRLPPIKISLNFQDAELQDVLGVISEETKLNIVAGKDIQGKVSVHLSDVPLENALNSILLTNGYSFIKEGNIIRVLPSAQVGEAAAASTTFRTEVFTLNFANADDIKSSIEKFLSADGLIQIFSRTNTSSSSGAGASMAGSTNNKLRPNILIIRDKPEVVKNISQIISKLDTEPKQILIDAKFVNVELTDVQKLGIDWTVTATLAGSSIPTTFPFKNRQKALDASGDFIPIHNNTDTDFEPGNIFPYATKTNFTFGSIDFTSFKAVLQALQQNTNTNIISAPKVAVVDGEEALINVGTNYPIPQYELNRETGQLFVSGYQIEKIGIILRVTPYAIGDGKVMMRLHPEVSEISGYVGQYKDRPITTTKEVSTTITVSDMDTVVIGGLIKENKSKNKNSVPFLGKIPLLGKLFTYDDNSTDRTELLLFVTPHISKVHNLGEIGYTEITQPK